MEGANQLTMSAIAVGIAFALTVYGKRVIAKSQKKADGGNPDTWGKDPVIQERHAQAQLQNQKYPSCQTWNDDFTVFLDTGDTAADGDMNNCFTNYGPSAKNGNVLNARYLTNPGGTELITYARQDPLAEDPSEHGVCWFNMDGQWVSFPDILGVDTAPNRSARLCFGAGETAINQGRFFQKKSDNSVTMAPTTLPGETPRCEGLVFIPTTSTRLPANLPPFTGVVNSILAWTSAGQPGMALKDCMSLGSVDRSTRYVTDANIVFTNPMTKQLEEMPNVPY